MYIILGSTIKLPACFIVGYILKLYLHIVKQVPTGFSLYLISKNMIFVYTMVTSIEVYLYFD